MRKRKGIGDRNPHVRDSHLGDDGAIDIFHHGMDDALRMDLDSDLFNGHIEKPVGLDHLQPLVHQGGGVDGDLLPHLPVGMVEGILDRHLVKSAEGEIEERASRCGEDEAMDILLPVAEQGLKDGAVFTVDGQDLDMVPLCLLHHDLSRHHQRFFIGQCDGLSGLDGREGWDEADRADDRGDHLIDLGMGGHLDQSFDSMDDFDWCIEERSL